MIRMPNNTLKWSVPAALAAVVGAGVLASAASAAAPSNSASPTISGTAREGSQLSASTGTWTNNPTSFSYQWQRCATDGTRCGDITGAGDKTYTPTSGDVTRTVRVIVTAGNTDGKTSVPSQSTAIVASKNGPSNTVKPSVTGSALVGEQLTVSNGSWSPTASSFTRQWQRCDANASSCLNIAGAVGRTYTVRSADVGHRLTSYVTAHTANGSATAVANATGVVADHTTTVTTTTSVTTTTPVNKAPRIQFLSLRRVGARVFVRFRVCDDRSQRVRVVERDRKGSLVSLNRHFTVGLQTSCASSARSWVPGHKFRTPGRLTIMLKAVDTSGRPSRTVGRSLLHR